jgi:hypothetical protein
MLKKFINRLPNRFKWTIHNVVAHPLSEILYQLGAEEVGNKIHDATVPDHWKGDGRG